MWSVV